VSGDDAATPLLTGVSQFDVDFVIPRAGIDLPVGIDPFLLYKSRDHGLLALHQQLLDAFNTGIDAIRHRDAASARVLFDYPEVAEIGFGYTHRGKRGSGVGSHLTDVIIETLTHSPALQHRGIRHVEEMQLVSARIGPDRVSDISANILKRYLIEYTQRQCAIWRIPLVQGTPLRHVYDTATLEWEDGYFDLPVSPVDGTPILLVPRRIVRVLPWINYDDFMRGEFKAYLASRRGVSRQNAQSDQPLGRVSEHPTKEAVVTITRNDVSLIDRYVKSREQARADAQPTFEYVDGDVCYQADHLKARLAAVEPGHATAAEYQQLVLEILNFLFNPELIDGQPEVRTAEGTERRDIIFTNDSDESFWDFTRSEHSSLLLMFEVKNVGALDMDDLNQTTTYLGDRLGTLGFIVTRHDPGEAIQRKAHSIWNDSAPKRKAIIFLTDAHVCELLDLRCRNHSTTGWMQRHYREFRQTVQ
jgi:hypothetical protein